MAKWGETGLLAVDSSYREIVLSLEKNRGAIAGLTARDMFKALL